jgi:hypothetical protein
MEKLHQMAAKYLPSGTNMVKKPANDAVSKSSSFTKEPGIHFYKKEHRIHLVP